MGRPVKVNSIYRTQFTPPVVAFPVSFEADCGGQDERNKGCKNSHSMLLDSRGRFTS
jgi:hypothetical protein